jgi:hypothetical protein
MSADAGGQEQAPKGAAPGSGTPSEAELRAAYEAELARITVTDVIAQTVVSLLNLAAQRLGPPAGGAGEAQEAAGGPAPGAGGGDLEQVRDAIDGTRGLLDVLERRIPQEVRPLRDALSQLQMAYAAAVGGGAAQPGAGEPGPAAEQAPAGQAGPAGASEGEGPGPAESSGRLWVPGR